MRLPWKKRAVAVPVEPTIIHASFRIPAPLLASDQLTVLDNHGAKVTISLGGDVGVLAEGDVIEVTARVISRKVTFSRTVGR